jgi:hypothetical protein
MIKMLRKLVPFFLLGILLGGCKMLNRPVPSATLVTSAGYSFETATEPPTQTPVPTSTITPSPTPDLGLVGLPTEAPGTTALDLVATMCSAQWFTPKTPKLPCPGNGAKSEAGFVESISENTLDALLTYPPQGNSDETIFSKYPPFSVQKGDRFRTVLSCKTHTFCDVVFSLEYYNEHGKTGMTNWPYIFSDSPVVIDYPLDGIAGKTVQFGLAVRGVGVRTEAYAVWIYPHIYRPIP